MSIVWITLDLKPKIYWRKSAIFDKKKKVIIRDLEWLLSSYFILWQICVFIMLALIQIYIKIDSLMNVQERKKLKSRKDEKKKLHIYGVFVRFIITYVLNHDVQIKHFFFQMVNSLWIGGWNKKAQPLATTNTVCIIYLFRSKYV